MAMPAASKNGMPLAKLTCSMVMRPSDAMICGSHITTPMLHERSRNLQTESARVGPFLSELNPPVSALTFSSKASCCSSQRFSPSASHFASTGLSSR
jgi:hypothetical protein